MIGTVSSGRAVGTHLLASWNGRAAIVTVAAATVITSTVSVVTRALA
jgi:hypothetical protein